MKQKYSFLSNDGWKRSLQWLLLFLLFMTSGGLAGANPVLIPDDILTFTGGEKDPIEDIYIIDMGEYEATKTYQVKVLRPKGAAANYDVSVEYTVLRGSMKNWMIDSTPHKLIFAPGETEKTIEVPMMIEGFSPYVPSSKGFETVFIFFNYASRTKTAFPVVQMNIQTHGTPVVQIYPNNQSHTQMSEFGAIGQYSLITQSFECKGGYSEYDVLFAELDSDVKYEAEVCQKPGPGIPIVLLPREIGATTQSVTYLYKFKEEDIVIDYFDPGYSGTYLDLLKTTNIKFFGSSESTTHYPNTMYSNVGYNVTNHSSFYIPPRFGQLTTNKTDYKSGENIRLTIPFLNADFFKASQSLDNSTLLKNVKLTIDGGKTFILSDQMTYNPTTKTIEVSFTGPIVDSGSETIYAEVLYDKMNPFWDPMEPEYNNDNRSLFIFGAYTSFTVTSETSAVVYTERLEMDETTVDYIDKYADWWVSNPMVKCKIYPEDCSFMGGVWSSSDPSVATIDSRGELKLLKDGITEIIFTSSEVAFRLEKGMPSNNELLIKKMTLYVEDKAPTLVSDYVNIPYHYYNDAEQLLKVSHTMGASWSIVGEASLKFVHQDSLTYAPIYKKITIDDSDSSSFRSDQFFQVEMPFGENFPKKCATPIDKGSYDYSARVYLDLKAQHVSGKIIELSNINLYHIIPPSPVTRLATNPTVRGSQQLYSETKPLCFELEIDNILDSLINYEYEVKRYSKEHPAGVYHTRGSFNGFTSQFHKPTWITFEPNGDFLTAKVKLEVTPSRPDPKYDREDHYNERYEVFFKVKNIASSWVWNSSFFSKNVYPTSKNAYVTSYFIHQNVFREIEWYGLTKSMMIIGNQTKL